MAKLKSPSVPPALLKVTGLLALAASAAGLAQAAPWPETLALRRQWWSLQPVKPETPPAVKDASWSEHPVDRFLLAKMEERNLKPATDAPARVVGRRLHYILTGLPPSPEEAAAFETGYAADPAQAVAGRVTALMALPRFGETWARHWMDLMRFAETHGSEGDAVIPSAWRYRDYLIRAFNNDVPLDQLIREHIAGDLLPSPRWNKAEDLNESVIGTAHFRLVEHGFQPIDSLDEQVRTVDSQIDVLSKAFQGLTVSCARCHDHKFDAVSQRDYYALYGVLSSSRPGQRTIDSPERLTEHDAELTALRGEIRQALAKSWLSTADSLPQRLLSQSARQQALASAREELGKISTETEALEAAARSEARLRRSQRQEATALTLVPVSTATATAGGGTGAALPRPWARWEFNGDTKDSTGALTGTLSGGAVIKDGRLLLNGVSAVMTAPPLPEAVTAKTLEAWVALTALDQNGGGLITVEKDGGSVFDSLVYAEKDAHQWMAGSDFGRRSASVPEALETSAPQALVHMACVYDAAGGIRLYRNGQPCGETYASKGPVHFPAETSRLLIGQRHTGGGQAFLAAGVEEARLYNRALTAAEIAASFRAGVEHLPEAEWLAAMSSENRSRFEDLRLKKTTADQALRQLTEADALSQAWDKALSEAVSDSTSPLHLWAAPHEKSGTGFAAAAGSLPGTAPAWEDQLREFANSNHGVPITDTEAQKWHGFGPHVTVEGTGGFHLQPVGEKVIDGLEPAGRTTDAVSSRRNGVLVSPRFKLDDSVWIRAWGGGNARVLVIVDQYPLGNNDTYPQAALNGSAPKWIRFDTAYRKGSWAYLQFTTDGDGMMQTGNTGTKRSWFGVESALTSSGKNAPPEPSDAALDILRSFGGPPPASSSPALAGAYGKALRQAVTAWNGGTLTPAAGRFLDYFVRRGLLPVSLPGNEVVAKFRQLEESLPEPRRAPGLLEAEGFNAPLFVRGDHHKPAAEVPRGYLEVLGGMKVSTPGSGRLELAEAIAGPGNPLTPRVMANRLWLTVFGRGLVATPDDFGKMGAAPSHPELLDFLAAKLAADGWSAKKMLTFLLTTRAFRESSTASEPATALDPDNTLLTHAQVRRLDAEPIRDTLLSVSGQFDSTVGGPGQDSSAPPEKQVRPSVYLTIRRTNLPAFLQVFDQPVPFSTTGRRMVTTVPAQSLALLNDPFVIHCAKSAAETDLRRFPDTPPEDRVRRLFDTILGRPPLPAELSECLTFLAPGGNAPPDAAAWADLAQSLFNAKEFLYLL
ncbi:MAG: DUF1553 domain-containing protein [Verrucomicrobiota bacterium]